MREISKLAGDTVAEMHRIEMECAPDQQCFHDRCQTLLQQNHPVFLNRQTELEAVMRAWWRDLHAEMEGYAQGIGSDDENAMAVTQIDTQGILGWNVILGGAKAWNGVPDVAQARLLRPAARAARRRPDGRPRRQPAQPLPALARPAEGEVRRRRRRHHERAAAGHQGHG